MLLPVIGVFKLTAYHLALKLQMPIISDLFISKTWLYNFVKQIKKPVFFFKECDQVHVEDVASDDNGQDLRWVICSLVTETIQYLITCILAWLHSSTSQLGKDLFLSSKQLTLYFFLPTLVTTTSWRMDLMVPVVEGRQEPPRESREGWSGCGNWLFATAG